jgi:hypothetical protein
MAMEVIHWGRLKDHWDLEEGLIEMAIDHAVVLKPMAGVHRVAPIVGMERVEYLATQRELSSKTGCTNRIRIAREGLVYSLSPTVVGAASAAMLLPQLWERLQPRCSCCSCGSGFSRDAFAAAVGAASAAMLLPQRHRKNNNKSACPPSL